MLKKIIVLISLLLIFYGINIFASDEIISDAKKIYDNGDYYKALMEYTQLLKSQSTAENYFERGNTKYKLGNYTGAIADYTASLEIEKSSQTYISKGMSELLIGNYDNAYIDFNEALKIKKSAEIYSLLAITNLKKDNVLESIENYTKVIKDIPNSYFYMKRGSLYQSIKEYDKALKDYTEAIDLDNTNISYYELRYKIYKILDDEYNANIDKAYIDILKENYSNAIREFSRSVDIKKDARIYYRLAILKARLKDYNSAVIDFTNSLNVKITKEAFFERGKIKRKMRKYKSAIWDFNMALGEQKDAKIYYELAETELLLKRYDDALLSYTKSIKMEQDIDVIVKKMQLLADLKKYQTIINETKKIVTKFSDYRLYNLIALANYELGDCDTSLMYLDESLKIKTNIETYLLIARVQEKLQDYNKAILNYSIAIDIEKDTIGFKAKETLQELYSKRSNLYSKIGRQDLVQADQGHLSSLKGSYRNTIAIDDFTKSISIKKTQEVYIARGILYLDNQDYKEALDDFNEALKLKETAEVYLYIGKVYIQQKEYDKALEILNKSLSLKETDEVYYSIAQIFEKQEKLEQAIQYYTKALSVKEKRIYYLSRSKLYERILKNDLALADKGNISVMFENYKNALTDYQNSLVIYENAFVYAKKGLVEEKLKMYEEALNDYISAIELDKTGMYLELKENLLSKLSEKQKIVFNLKQFEKILNQQ